MSQFDVIVVGGGAAGLIAAGHSAELGANVLLLEKMGRPGRKLGITGKGRCNITNTASIQEFISCVKPNGRFLQSAFSGFFSEELLNFINNIGIKTIIERGGRIFPESGKAVELVNALIKFCISKGVQIKGNAKVNSLIVEDKKIVGVSVTIKNLNKKNTLTFYGKTVIIATGGRSYPATGSTGDGYILARSAGHKIVPARPSLVPLETDENILKRLKGLELRNVRGTILIDNINVAEEFGDISFTDFCITGPIILTLSRDIVPALMLKKEVIICIDMKAALDHTKLDNRLLKEFDSQGSNNFRTILNKLLPKKLIPVCIDETGIDREKPGHQLTSNDRERLRNWLKEFKLRITGYRPFSEAIITAGGIDTNEIDQKTMASKIIKGLYFAGEVMDIDGPTGGYNLQIAFSTGWLAGKSSAVNK